MATAVLIVPPFIKYSAGPLLGPARCCNLPQRRMVTSVPSLDLNALFIQPRASPRTKHGAFVGDHNKPTGPQSLAHVERTFLTDHLLPCFGSEAASDSMRRVKFGFLDHADVHQAATKLASSSFGDWARRHMSSQSPPQLTGISILHAGQVVPAVATSILARQLWPDTLVVWGGPHVSGLGDTIPVDIRKRSFAADVFVTGHAEQTFTKLLDRLASGDSILERNAVPIHLQGKSGPAVPPIFDNLAIYDEPLTLPAHSTLGCAFGKCAFCTYPAIEPVPAKLPLLVSVGSVVDTAHSLGASVSIKDSLATPLRLKEIAGCVQGRVPWSACTKLSRKFDVDTLNQLRDGGLATLEVGLKSLLPDTQLRLGKLQPLPLYEKFLRNVAEVPDLTLVVNYMTHFPWEDDERSLGGLQEARELLLTHFGQRGTVEHNTFELERLSPIARDPTRYGVKDIKSWPWGSVLEYSTDNK